MYSREDRRSEDCSYKSEEKLGRSISVLYNIFSKTGPKNKQQNCKLVCTVCITSWYSWVSFEVKFSKLN